MDAAGIFDTLAEHSEPLRILYGVWDRARGANILPRRSALKPSDLAAIARNVSILELKNGNLVFRLYGASVAERTGVDLTGETPSNFFSLAGREKIKLAAELGLGQPCGVVAAFDVKYKSGVKREVEMLALPICNAQGKPTQIIAVTVPRERHIVDLQQPGFAMGFSFYEFRALDIGAGIPPEPRMI